MSTLQQDILYEMLLCTKYGCKQYPQCDEPGQCAICMDNLKNKYVIKTHCNHFFHIDCFMFSMRYKHFACIECEEPFEKIEK